MPSKIGWTHETWNPVTGCSKVSEGCQHCYAEAISLRQGWSRKPWTVPNAAENVVCHPERLSKPRGWRRPRLIFVNSMSDLFHPLVVNQPSQDGLTFLDAVFGVMALTPHHTYQILTKRPTEALAWWTDPVRPTRVTLAAHRAKWAHEPHQYHDPAMPVSWPLPNVWIGTSVEHQRWAAPRLAPLTQIPASVRFVSCEPLLGALNVTPWLDELDWIIAGAESGPGARPMDDNWVRSLRDQCQARRVPFFFKQRAHQGRKEVHPILDGREWAEFPTPLR